LRFGRYRIVERLNAGGMGEVYRAVALGTAGFAKPVVIKLIHRTHAANPNLVQRFVNEAKILTNLSHRNVVQVLDLGKVDDQYFIALEFVDGADLRRLLERCAALKKWPSRAISVFITIEVLRGLDFAHRRTDEQGKRLGLIHRDITPANVLCSYEGEVRITDFGLARTLAPSELTGNRVVGTYRYMSPEQAAGDPVDQRSDLFSLGSVLYLLLCARPPFDATKPARLIDQVISARYPRPGDLGLQMPERLAAIVEQALIKPVDQRFASAEVMLRALEGYERATTRATVSDMRALMEELFAEELRVRRGFLPGAEEEAALLEFEASGPTPGDAEVSQYGFTPGNASHPAPAPIVSPQGSDPARSAAPARRPAALAPRDSLTDWHDRKQPAPQIESLASALEGVETKVEVPSSHSGRGRQAPSRPLDQRPTKLEGDAPRRRRPPSRPIAERPTELEVDQSADAPAPIQQPTVLETAQRRRQGKAISLTMLLVVLVGGAAGLYIFARKKGDPATTASEGQAELVVRTEPPGARITLDGKALDQPTPFTIAGLRLGTSHHLMLALDRHSPVERQVKITSLRTQLSLRLERRLGRLRLDSVPGGVEVLADGQPRGKTPLTLELPLGPVELRLEHPGYRPWQRTVALLQERPERRVRAQLQPLPASQPVSKATGHPASKARPDPGRARPTASRGEGWLRVSTQPAYAQVFIGDRLVGETPCRVRLPAGSQMVRLVNPGLGKTVTRRVQIRKDRDTELFVPDFQ
jgi:serine/threonine protein kinase